MSIQSEIAEPRIDERTVPYLHENETTQGDGPYIVILYNDDHHEQMEVTGQLQKATGYNLEKCELIMFEAYQNGRAIAYSGSEEACERAAHILRQIRLQVETDKF